MNNRRRNALYHGHYKSKWGPSTKSLYTSAIEVAETFYGVNFGRSVTDTCCNLIKQGQ